MHTDPLEHPVKKAAIQAAAIGLRGVLLATLWPMAFASRLVSRMPRLSGGQ